MERRWPVCMLSLLVLTGAASVRSLEYTINTTWNGQVVDHDPVNLTFSASSNKEYLYLDIVAPFFNDPTAPDGPPGQPFFGLWEYEVVEAFFLNDQNQYVEVEVCPWSQHIVLLLSGQRVTVRHSLPLEVTTTRTADTWTGRAKIPVSYLPINVTKFNAYAIHGSGANRIYESLFPADENATAPDFHALQFFESIDLSGLLPNQAAAPMSQLWTDALEGLFRYHISTTWDSQPLNSSPVQFTLQGFESGVELNVTAPFYDDPAPEGPAGQPFYGLWDYEVVEMFFLNNNEEYLEVELGPYGQHLLLLLKGQRNTIKHSLSLDYVVSRAPSTDANIPGEWKGSAMIPPGYFPPNVTRMNAYAIHGVGNARQYQALYPAPYNNVNYSNPDFHQLSLFQPIDFEYQVKDNSQYSVVWQDAMTSGARTPASKAEEEVEALTVLGPVQTTPEPTTLPPTTVQPTTYETMAFDTTTPESATVLPTIVPSLEEELETQPTPKQDVTPQPKKPQPQKVDITVFRGHQVEGEDQSSLQQAPLQPGPVPKPQLFVISRGHPSRQFGTQRNSQRITQRGSQRFSLQQPSVQNQRRRQSTTQEHPQRNQNHFQGQQNQQQSQQFQSQRRRQDQTSLPEQKQFHNQRRPQDETFQPDQGHFLNQRRPQDQTFRPEQEQIHNQRKPQDETFRPDQGHFLNQRRPQDQTSIPEQEQIHNQRRPQDETFHPDQGHFLNQRRPQDQTFRPEQEQIHNQRRPQDGTFQPDQDHFLNQRRPQGQLFQSDQGQSQRRPQDQSFQPDQGQFQDQSRPVDQSFHNQNVFRGQHFQQQEAETSIPGSEVSRTPEQMVHIEAEEVALREAEEAAIREAEEMALREAEEAAIKEAKEVALREAEEAARREVEEAARREAEETARREAEEAARRKAEEAARREAEKVARREAEEAARREAEEAARREAEIGVSEAEEATQREAEAVASLAEQSPSLPPSHPVCFQPGLVADEDRCWVFYECVLVDGAWEVYSWKCMRGHVFDDVSVSCIKGRCRRRG